MSRQSETEMRAARQSANRRLTLAGIKPVYGGQGGMFVAYIERRTGFKALPDEPVIDYLRRFAAQPLESVKNPRVAGPRATVKFKPLAINRHPRQDENDAMPRQIGMGGVGNGVEYSRVWRR
uniref:hypothetical protein n=1 Tax=Castellaniella defragrans TaxID=75697 RepID=UPI00333EDED2